MHNKNCFVISVLLLTAMFFFAGCGGKKKVVKKDYGKPVHLEIDTSKLPPVSEDETVLEDGKITIFDPVNWERQPRGAAKAKKGFKTLIVFTKDNATLLMTRSTDTEGLPNLSEENIEEFAENTQQLFKSKVQIVKLGEQTGVYFSRRVADAKRLSKFYERQIVATAIGGILYTYELILTEGKIDDALRDVLFAMVSKVKIEGVAPKMVEIAAGEPEPKPEVSPSPAGADEEEKPKPAEPKPPKKPVDKEKMKAILNELDALLN
jgi:hypothetical protein